MLLVFLIINVSSIQFYCRLQQALKLELILIMPKFAHDGDRTARVPTAPDHHAIMREIPNPVPEAIPDCLLGKRTGIQPWILFDMAWELKIILVDFVMRVIDGDVVEVCEEGGGVGEGEGGGGAGGAAG